MAVQYVAQHLPGRQAGNGDETQRQAASTRLLDGSEGARSGKRPVFPVAQADVRHGVLECEEGGAGHARGQARLDAL